MDCLEIFLKDPETEGKINDVLCCGKSIRLTVQTPFTCAQNWHSVPTCSTTPEMYLALLHV